MGKDELHVVSIFCNFADIPALAAMLMPRRARNL